VNNKYIVIEGNIGAGKTSLARKMAEDFKSRLMLEQFEDNPFLPKFYMDPEKYSFPLEISFLASRYQQIKRESAARESRPGTVIADYSVSKSLIFAQINLQLDEFKLYRNLFNIIHQQLPRPDLYVYLHVTVDKLMENIGKRDRDYEREITPDYLAKLQQGYFEYFRSLQDQKILVLDVNNLDFVNRQEDYKTIEAAIFREDYSPGLNRLVLP